MKKLFRLLKPGVPRSVHLFAAPFLWTAVGCMLIYRGWGWLDPGRGKLLVLLSGLLGTMKSLFILDAIARKSLQRIVVFKDHTCLGAVYSWKSWLVVGVMIFAGVALRHIVQPGPLIGTLYVAVGWSLCWSSRLGWQQWMHLVRGNEIA